MGVTGLWTVVQPCARPIKLETLNKKRLAVDASIWIYQFLKAVRDKEGNALRNSHVVGFFRRICKLLFFGIKPVFVFDGGAPILKRQTISGRKARKEGRREDAVRTAGKLLAVQMQRRAEEEDQKRREERERPRQEEEEELPENLVYVDELQMTKQERQQNRTFRKKDAYHLPNLDVDLADMGAPNDPRIMSHEELEEYARQFHTGEDINLYDFSKIDFESPFFQSLPASDRYNILNAARLRSRLRMGYSKEQLDTMFPNRMDFSRFQIDRVKERNELTQRLMNINGMNGEDAMASTNDGGRVAGEKGKEYVLVKNDGVEGGWALGVVSNKQREGERSKPIDVERMDQTDHVDEADDDWEDDGFEDVPIEGLNRLPKKLRTDETLEKQRRALYESRMQAANPTAVEEVGQEGDDEDSLFIPQQIDHHPSNQLEDEGLDELFEDVHVPIEDDEEDLQRAIAMSLEDPDENSLEETEPPSFADSATAGPRTDRPLEFNQKNAKAGRDFAHLANARAHVSAPRPFADDSEDEDNDNALEGQRTDGTVRKVHAGPKVHGFQRPDRSALQPTRLLLDESRSMPSGLNGISTKSTPFDGPLPFESLSLGKSILGQKKKKPAEVEAGGFEKDTDKEKPAQPLPPWFSGDIRKDSAKQKAIEEKQLDDISSNSKPFLFPEKQILRRQETGEVIDLEAPEDQHPEVINIDGEEEGGEEDVALTGVNSVDAEVRMDDIADLTRAAPPVPQEKSHMPKSPAERKSEGETFRALTPTSKAGSSDEEPIDWSESEPENESHQEPPKATTIEIEDKPAQAERAQPVASEPGSDEMPRLPLQQESCQDDSPASLKSHHSLQDQSSDGALLEAYQDVDDEDFSDPEDEELLRQMAVEAEEHARFAAELNSKSQVQSAEDYEKELRQLRNQQKKDRRDADEVTHIMVSECQQLLRLFGLPYITAPMEAEAQCAELVSLGLVDGIVTDDSDVFLFGGTRIYKNMFNQSKFVECYLAADLEKEYALDRRKLIRFAHLLGSDYTEGLPSVGPVTALEILSEFETLEQFSEWWSTVQLGQPLSAADAANPFRRKFRKNASKLFLPTTFPDTRVDHAYLNPEVDSDPQPFQWGVPDLDRLRQFLMATIGWSQDRTDEVLVPVIRDMNRREHEGTQANITHFFGGGVGLGAKATSASNSGSGGQGFAPRRKAGGKSDRMENALGRLHKKAKEKGTESRTHIADETENSHGTETTIADNLQSNGISTQGNGRKKRGATGVEEEEDSVDSDEDFHDTPNKARRLARGKRTRAKR